MNGSLVIDLGISPGVWLFLSLLLCLTIFFKFSRFWSVRNLDLLLLFALAPGMLWLVGSEPQPWMAFVWLFAGSALWLVRCLLDLGDSRRPFLEPNLNMAGLACMAIGVLGLLLAETVSLPLYEGAARNPAEPSGRDDPPPAGTVGPNAPIAKAVKNAPLPTALRPNPPQEILKRVLASLAQLGLVAALIGVGWRHFERPVTGLAVATCYLLLPYTRIALVDCGQILPAALIVTALLFYNRPRLAGALIGLAAGWMPACLGLVPLWAGFYRGRGAKRFLAVGLLVLCVCVLLTMTLPVRLDVWGRALGARSLKEAGLTLNFESPSVGSFWSRVDGHYRIPVLILYLAFVTIVTFWPAQKNLGELIALSAALLVGSQFWFLAEGGTMIVLYLPLTILMMFRPNLSGKRALPLATRERAAHGSLFPVR
ncbi:MAG: hypothetical protein P4L84_06445 [Isosphaeraceae bacterium]|nr:hypothetical protein [Isosphaeraceae bacterium]